MAHICLIILTSRNSTVILKRYHTTVDSNDVGMALVLIPSASRMGVALFCRGQQDLVTLQAQH